MDKLTLENLDYYKLKELIKSYCVSGLGKNLIDKIEPIFNLKVVKQRLKETTEGRNLLNASYHLPLEGIFNVIPLIDKIEKGLILEPEELYSISNFLRGSRKVKIFLKDKEAYAETLCEYGKNITELYYLEEEINISIRGNSVDTNASKELKRIRRHIEICEGKIKEKLEKFLKNSANKEYIQDNFISQRNGKYTIPIKASYKNNVGGVIIETSANGKTVFIEPASVSKYTAELAVFKAEEAVEEYRILSTLTDMIYQRLKEIKINIDVIAQYDMIWAKAKYSNAINGIEPKINIHGYTKIVEGKYPLITYAVPLNFEIGKNYRTLIITGPNAGGKTVVLKNVGLLTLAVQSGFHIPAKEGTEISLFENIFVDIGDNQSIENALSTFSSHVSNLARIIKNSNKSTLLLFDEIGSGTEPGEGAALAIAILEELYLKGCITVATTHYGEIKEFSMKHPDFENAAMEFEKDSLAPLYKLSIGKSGKSNALYISRKMGIPESILDKAKKYMSNKEYNYSLIKESKKIKEKINEGKIPIYEFKKGDKVKLLDKNDFALVYNGINEYNNLIVLYKGEYLTINIKRVELDLKAEDLYPEGYNLDELFVSYKERKLEKDIQRGSKKALRKIKKELIK